MSDKELLACPNPWCSKSKPVLMRGGFRNRYQRIQCETCGTAGPQNEFGGEAQAIKDWNTRKDRARPIAQAVGEVEPAAWDWLDRYRPSPEDVDYSADQMVDAFMAGRAHATAARIERDGSGART